jgi:arsenite methyltransferase
MAEYNDINRRRQAGPSLRHDTAELASTYDQVNLHHLFKHGKALIGALNISSGEVVLDIGAGTGSLATYVAEIVGPAGFVVAMDPLPSRVEIAQSKASDNLEACVGRAEDLSDFLDETFNVVYLNSVFHWVEDKSQALAEIFRVLTPGGRLGLTCADPTRPYEGFRFIRRAFMEAGAEHNRLTAHRDLLTDYKLGRLVTDAGFVSYKSELKTFVNVYPNVDALLAETESAFFGNFLNSYLNSSEVFRARVQNALSRLLETKRRDDQRIGLKRYLIFATARKPN